MNKLKSRYTGYGFKGTRGLPVTMAASAIDKGSIGFSGENIVEIGSGGAGGFYQAGPVDGTPGILDQNLPLFVYVLGTTNYNGLKRIYNVRTGRYVQIFADFVAEVFSGATQRVGYEAEVASEFGGFSVHLANVEDAGIFNVIIHSARGAAFDNLLYSKDMIGVQDINRMFNPPRYLAPGDRIDVTTNITETFGIILYVRKLS